MAGFAVSLDHFKQHKGKDRQIDRYVRLIDMQRDRKIEGLKMMFEQMVDKL